MEVLNAQGMDCYHSHDYPASLEAFNEALSYHPHATLYANRAAVYLALDRSEEAIRDAEACLRLRPDWYKPYLRLGVAQRCVRQWEQAMDALRAAFDLHPHTAIAALIHQTQLDMCFSPLTQNLDVSVRFMEGAKLGDAPNKGVITTTAFEKGQLVFEETPCVSIQSILSLGVPACSHCIRSLADLSQLPWPPRKKRPPKPVVVKCHGCDTIYCSETCRSLAWAQYHTVQCQNSAYASFENWCRATVSSYPAPPELLDVILSTTLLVGRMFCTQAQSQPQVRPYASFVYGSSGLKQEHLAFDYQPAYELLSAAFPQPPTQQEFYKMHRRVALSCCRVRSSPLPALVNQPGPADIDSYLDTTTSEGIGLFTLHGSINHSCVPNVQVECEENHCIKVVSTVSLEAGQQLFANYMSDDLPFDQRQRHLQQCYEFHCHCERCVRGV
eukprot:NODE_1607_length_1442_cov_16.871483_g1524_i0.p1 GENE.NODE_1607_length_1442_cov_16.871483_g1524_i0~~NODE_1607_length_1442_cov_16.871483_g1524_i0.p1  ORF type:complete len:450 (+),score=75.96 NODE_1607_length_1442_cov_16.871483_g1524_i0:25-1350(+)